MLIVRNCFIAKPGSAGKLSSMMKTAFAAAGIPKHRVLTDFLASYELRPGTVVR